jgi:DHA1 family multidrug resistance protein-like MFS transporter
MSLNNVQDRSWIKLLALFTLGTFIEAMLYGHLNAFTPLYLPKLGIAPEDITRWTGLITSISGIPGLLFLPFWGALADKFSRKPVIIRSFVVHILVATSVILAGNVWFFMLGRALSGLALGNSGLMMTTLAERSPESRRGFVFAIMNTATPIGVFAGPLLGGFIMDRWGFRTLMMIDALVLFILVIGMMLAYSDIFKPSDDRPILKMAVESIHIITDNPSLLSLFPALFMLFAGWMLAMTYVPIAISKLYIGQNLASTVGIILGAGGFVAIILGPLLGSLADRYGQWRVLFIGAAIQIFLWPILALVPGLASFGVAYAIVNGIGSGVFAISFSVIASSTTSNVRGRVMSFAFLPVNIGVFLGPLIGSVVTRNTVFAAFPTAAILTTLGLGLLAFAYKNRLLAAESPI